MDKVLRESDVLRWMADLDRAIDNLRSQIAEREAERAKAQMVLEVLGSRGADTGANEQPKTTLNIPPSASSDVLEAEEPSQPQLGTDRPMGIPTTRQMVLTVVREANRQGKGIALSEIFDGIRQRWWADAPSNRLRPMVWSLWKEKGVLKREGELYFAEPLIDPKNKASSEREFEEA